MTKRLDGLQDGFAQWIRYQERKPRGGQTVIIRSTQGGIYLCTFHSMEDEADSYFNLCCYSPDLKLGYWRAADVLQWTHVLGFE